MSISLGSTNFGSIYLGSTKIGEAYLGSVKVYGPAQPDPYNPLNLPPYTIRLKFNDGVTPTFSEGGTGVQVSSSPNVWDLTHQNPAWYYLLDSQTDLIEVLGANTSSVTNMLRMFNRCSSLTKIQLFDTRSVTSMNYMFQGCTNLTLSGIPLFDTSSVTGMAYMFQRCSGLTSVPLLNTSSVTNIDGMFKDCTSLTSVPLLDTGSVSSMLYTFQGCTSLTSIPLFDTRSVTKMNYAFRDCFNVESGALSLYQQASSQPVPPTNHEHTFENCGRDTVTGAAELAQIPSNWK